MRKFEEKVTNWIENFSNKTVNDMTIKKVLEYNDYSLWPFLKWFFVNGDFYFQSIHTTIWNLENDKPQDTFINYSSLYFKRGRTFIRYLIGKLFKTGKQCDILATFSFPNTDFVENKTIKKGHIFTPIYNNLDKSKKYLVVDIPYGNQIIPRNLFLKKENLSFTPLESYLTVGTYIRARKKHKQIVKKWKIFKGGLYFKSSLKKILLPQLDFFIGKYLFDIILDMEILDNIFLKERPKLSIVTYKALIGIEQTLKGKEKKIKIMAISHGGICGGYDHIFKELQPEKILTIGEFDREFMIKNNDNSSEQVEAVGHIIYDPLFFKQKSFDKNKILEKYDLPKDKKIMLFSSPTPSDALDKMEAFKIALSSLNKEYFLIVKLHPGEQEEGYLFQESLSRDDCKIVDGNIYELLAVSDLLITTYSTTIIDAFVMGKIPVIIDVFKRGYNQLLSLKTPQITNKREFKSFIDKYYHNDDFKNFVHRLSENFISNKCYKIDGKTCERIAETIKEELK